MSFLCQVHNHHTLSCVFCKLRRIPFAGQNRLEVVGPLCESYTKTALKSGWECRVARLLRKVGGGCFGGCSKTIGHAKETILAEGFWIYFPLGTASERFLI